MATERSGEGFRVAVGSDATEQRLRGDEPTDDPANDRLGYAPIARTIATSLRAQIGRQDGLVYGVHGAWGSGKTTVLRFVLHELRDETDADEIKVVRFNPWWFSGQEDLTRAFFDELTAVIGTELDDKAKGALKRFASGVSGASGLLKYGMGLIPGAALVPEELRSQIVDALSSLADETPPSLNEQRRIVEKALAGATFRTLVVIDDVDRLTSDEQLQVFRLVKSVADLPKIDYLLAFDDDLAAKALTARPEYAADTGYLEKIVQAPFHLPVLEQYALSDWLISLIEDFVTTEEIAPGDHWQGVLRSIVNPLVMTPRSVVKLADALRTRWPSARGEAVFADLLAIEAIRLFDRPLYRAIREEGLWLTGEDKTFSKEREKERAEGFLARFEEASRRQFAERAVSALFPRFKELTGSSFFGGDAKKARGLGIANSNRFGIYFGTDLGSQAVSRQAVLALFEPAFDVAGAADMFRRAAGIARRTGGTMAPVLMDELEQVWPDLDDDARTALLDALLRYGDLLITDADFKALSFSWGTDDRLRSLLRRLLHALPQERRFPVLQNAVGSPNGSTPVTYLLHTLSGEHKRHGIDWQNDFGEPVLEEDDVARLERELHAALLERLDDEALDGLSDSTRIIGLWSRFAPGTELEEHLDVLKRTSDGRVRLAKLLVSPRGWNSSRGAYDVVPKFEDGPIDVATVIDAVREDAELANDSVDPVLHRFLAAAKNSNRDDE